LDTNSSEWNEAERRFWCLYWAELGRELINDGQKTFACSARSASEGHPDTRSMAAFFRV
jgi:hypothetical protein